MRFVLTAFIMCVILYGIKADWMTTDGPIVSPCPSTEEYSLATSHASTSLESLYEQEDIPLSYVEWLQLIEQLNPPSNLSSDMIVYPVWETSC